MGLDSGYEGIRSKVRGYQIQGTRVLLEIISGVQITKVGIRGNGLEAVSDVIVAGLVTS